MQAHELGLDGTVKFLGFRDDVPRLLSSFDIFVLASLQEGLSIALVEAMALGKPVIASAATGNLEVITDRVDGRLVDPFAPQAWAEAIEELLSQPAAATRLGSVARHTARVTYSLERTVERTTDLYRSLVDPP